MKFEKENLKNFLKSTLRRRREFVGNDILYKY